MCVCIIKSLYIYVYVYIYMHIYTHTHTYLHVFTYIFTYTYECVHASSKVRSLHSSLDSIPGLLRTVLQCVAMCCSVLQCVAVCCSVLQCFLLGYTCSRVSALQNVTNSITMEPTLENAYK